MQRFHKIEEGCVTLRVRGGTYRQADVYRRGRDVFAAVGGGYVRLLSRSGTTAPSVSWDEIEAEGVEVDRLGVPRFTAEDQPDAVKAA